MLQISRKIGEKIVIGSDPGAIVVTLIEVRGNQVRLGIQAPAEVPIWREELYRQMNGKGVPHVPSNG